MRAINKISSSTISGRIENFVRELDDDRLKTHARSQHNRVVRLEVWRVLGEEHNFAIEYIANFNMAADMRLCFPFEAANHADVVVIDAIISGFPRDGP